MSLIPLTDSMKNSAEKIGIGTAQFGMHYGISNQSGQTSERDVAQILSTAKEHHIHLIDTASAYGNAEKILGLNDLNEFQVVSKFMPALVKGDLRKQCLESLERLRIPSLYGYLAHRPIPLADDPGCWEDLITLREAKLVKKIGYSLYNPEELDLLLDKHFLPDLIQVPYNYFDRRFEKHLVELQKKGCEIHVRSVFLQGLFFLDTDTLNSYFEDVKPVIKKLQLTVNNLPSALLNFVIRKPFIDKIIIGVETNEQLIRNLQGLSMEEVLPELNNQIQEHILNPSTWPKII
jgi:aryl-alcohol dehydrogenase-like predicted oxidoreductase